MLEFLKKLQANPNAEMPAVNVRQKAINDVLDSYLGGIKNNQMPYTTDLVNKIGADALTNGVRQGLNFGNKEIADWQNQYINSAEGKGFGYKIPQTEQELRLAKQNQLNTFVNPLEGGIKEETPQIKARHNTWDSVMGGLKDFGAGFKENATSPFKFDNLQKRVDPLEFKKSINPDDYNTQLSPEDETKYAQWFKDNQAKGYINPNDSGSDYDFRGAYKAGYIPTEQGGHWLDTYKKPNHETFSNESKYATGNNARYAGKWDGDKFIAPRNENVMTKIGEAMGSVGKFVASPTGKGLIVGGLVGATGGSPLQSLAYGGSAMVQNQKNKMQDQLYRNQLKELGYSDEDLSSIGGYIDQNTYKAVSDGAYKLQYGNYRNRKLDQDSYIKLKHYYDLQLKSGSLDPVTYQMNIKDLNNRFINDNIATANAGNVSTSNDTKKTDSTIKLNNAKTKYTNVMSEEQPKRTEIQRIKANKSGGSGGNVVGGKGSGKKNPMYGAHLAEYNEIIASGDKNRINYARNNFIRVYGEDPDKSIKQENDILKFLDEE